MSTQCKIKKQIPRFSRDDEAFGWLVSGEQKATASRNDKSNLTHGSISSEMTQFLLRLHQRHQRLLVFDVQSHASVEDALPNCFQLCRA
jgi:hypothetical protein